MKALAWGANCVLILAVGLVLQGCGYKMVKQKDWLDKDEQMSNLRSANDTASAKLRAELDLNNKLNSDLADRNDTIDQFKRQMGTMGVALTTKVEYEKKLDELTGRLGKELAGTGASVEGTPMGTVVKMEGDVLFSSGKVDIKKDAEKTLDRIADAIKGEDREIGVSGFTDSDPIVHSPWKTNMRLSGERAMAVMEYLAAKGVPAERIHYAGYGEYKTMKDDAGAENKKASRRVEILLMTPQAGEGAAPAMAPAKTKSPEPEKKTPPVK